MDTKQLTTDGIAVRSSFQSIVFKRAVLAASVAAATIGAGAAAPAFAQQAGDTQVRRYEIPSGSLEAALTAFAKTSGVMLGYQPDLVKGRASNGLRGDFATADALRRLLDGSGLEAIKDGDTWTLRVAAPAGGSEKTLSAVRVVDSVDQGFAAKTQESASKTGLTIRETPQSVSVVTYDQIKTRQVRSTKQALETVAGVNQYSGPGPFGGTSGFGFFATQVRGVDIDQRFDMREDGFISPPFYTRPDLAIYERIEVVKGPSSVLNGRGSAGGYINQIRKKPKAEYAAEYEVSVGSWDLYRLDADITGPITASKNVRGRIVAATEDSDSFVKGVESNRLLFAPSVEADITDSTRLLVQALYQKERLIGNPGVPLVKDGDDYNAPDIPRTRFFGIPNEKKNTWETQGITAQLDQQIGDNWLATLRLSRSKTKTPIDMDSYAYAYGGVDASGAVPLISAAFDPNDTDVWSSELRVQGELELFGREAKIGFGADRAKVETHRIDLAYQALGVIDIHATNFADFPTIDPTEESSDALQTQKTAGVYAELHVRPLEKLGVLAGVRYDRVDTSNYFAMTGSVPTDASSKKSDTTGRIGVTYDLTPELTAYGLYAQSFKPVSSLGQNGSVLDPETGEIFELGVKTLLLNGRLAANASAFRIDRDDVPITIPGLSPSRSRSSGVQRSEGVELEINGELLPGWTLSFGGTVLNSDFIERDDTANYGKQPKGAANWQLGAYTGYEVQSGALRGFGLGVGAFAIGDRWLDAGYVDGYERFDVSAFYNGFQNVKIALQVRNVTDETYIEGYDRAGAYAQFGSPTAVLLSVRFLDGAAK